MGENCEWRIKIEAAPECISRIVKKPFSVFANNGYGDYLFLKKEVGGEHYSDKVYEYFHEGPEITRVNESLEVLIGLEDRPPSDDDYPKAVYESGELVQLEDQVKIKVWAEFWKGWQDAIVEYVPGISKKELSHEHGGLKWVVIQFRNGEICPLVDPDNGTLKKVRFVARGV